MPLCIYCEQPLRELRRTNEFYCDHCRQLYRAAILPAAHPPAIDWFDLAVRAVQSDMKRRRLLCQDSTSNTNSGQSTTR